MGCTPVHYPCFLATKESLSMQHVVTLQKEETETEYKSGVTVLICFTLMSVGCIFISTFSGSIFSFQWLGRFREISAGKMLSAENWNSAPWRVTLAGEILSTMDSDWPAHQNKRNTFTIQGQISSLLYYMPSTHRHCISFNVDHLDAELL